MTSLTVSEIVNARRIINGPSDNLRALSAHKYSWCMPLWSQMQENNWTAQQVPLKRDKAQFKDLSKGDQFTYKAALAFLSNLDAIQVDNLTMNIAGVITDPSVRSLISRQTYEEALHNESYSFIVEEMFGDPMEIYYMASDVPVLQQKNKLIINRGAEVTLEPTPQNKIKAMVSNVCLEGIYFFSGFLSFYSIARSTGSMLESRDMIRYIHRDELTHLNIFTNAFIEARREFPEIFTPEFLEECKQIVRDAVALETKWFEYCSQYGTSGLNASGGAFFLQVRGEKVAQAMGIGGIWPNVINPYTWFDDYSSVEAMNNTQKNFFEGKNVRYSERIPTFTRGRVRTGLSPSMA